MFLGWHTRWLYCGGNGKRRKEKAVDCLEEVGWALWVYPADVRIDEVDISSVIEMPIFLCNTAR